MSKKFVFDPEEKPLDDDDAGADAFRPAMASFEMKHINKLKIW